ncbi:hemolysin activation/secretion protein [Aphanothece hegewaldii CCALA 016]|uniref:Hemolysin activation/secretion protein n=1 Tax=Aphanothece hegewaldii CCALA 016 TaxID=2107694 RepID=A0A2T1LXF6_9CHRO|nr:ShlB/FhaC/HecB family hemolysin secretion/activation protein [Aphanothece hegewaldii]PSF37059.1 hemolysin activation/secretion protein [Aphanothece hegewaldii CCALA 016]
MNSIQNFLALTLVGSILPVNASQTLAQIPTRPDPITPVPPLEKPQPIEKPQLEIPPPQTPPAPFEEIPGTIKVNGFEFIDNTAFSNEELNEVVKNFIGKELTFSDLIAIEEIITNLYISNGYINSGAVIEAGQSLSPEGAIVKITIIEGGIEDIKVTGTRRLRPEYVRSRLGLAVQTPLNQNRLLEALQLLQLDPQIKNISAQLSAGVRPDLSLLEVEVTEADTFNIDVFANNGRNPSVGSFQRGVYIQERNLFGFGDSIDLTYNNTDGSNAVDLSYVIPVSPHNTTIRLAGGYSSNEVVDRLFNDIDLTGNYYYYELSFRQPLIQSPTQEFALGLTLSRQESKNFLEGEGFPLSAGANNQGEVRISAIRLFQDWVKRNPREVIAVNSQFSIGVNAFDSTINSDGIPDGTFFAWRGQGQYVRLLAPETLLVVRSDLQLSNEPLLALEQFSVGGLGSVRGYRQDLLLTDNGVLLSTEVRLPILRVSRIEGVLQVIPFIDFGVGWNNGEFSNPDPNTLVGVGLGLLWQMGERLNARFDWGIPLVSTDVEKDSLNDRGLYFSLNFRF